MSIMPGQDIDSAPPPQYVVGVPVRSQAPDRLQLLCERFGPVPFGDFVAGGTPRGCTTAGEFGEDRRS